MMEQAQDDDRRLRRTTVGVHKDDVVFKLGDHALNKFGSQGQQKSFLVSLRLAQFAFIEQATGVKPVLLLDDIFDKIDEKRVEALMRRVTNGAFGQVFITDTHLGRIPAMFEQTGADVKVFEVKEGEVSPVEFEGHEEKASTVCAILPTTSARKTVLDRWPTSSNIS